MYTIISHELKIPLRISILLNDIFYRWGGNYRPSNPEKSYFSSVKVHLNVSSSNSFGSGDVALFCKYNYCLRFSIAVKARYCKMARRKCRNFSNLLTQMLHQNLLLHNFAEILIIWRHLFCFVIYTRTYCKRMTISAKVSAVSIDLQH